MCSLRLWALLQRRVAARAIMSLHARLCYRGHSVTACLALHFCVARRTSRHGSDVLGSLLKGRLANHARDAAWAADKYLGRHSRLPVLPSTSALTVKGIPHLVLTVVSSPISFLIAAVSGRLLPITKPARGQAFRVTSFPMSCCL